VLALLAPEFPDAHLTMLGPDKGDGTRQAAQREARDLGVESRIDFPGKVPKPEISNWMNRGDIFLNTTNIDNTPMTVMEAMACGLCVVSTNVGGIPYLLKDRYDALLVQPGDPEAAASAVRRILTEPALAESLSRNARQKVEHFDWTAVLPVWEKILLSVAARGAGVNGRASGLGSI
jgi:glycosyltransferase involved in cell wall biosynthesis